MSNSIKFRADKFRFLIIHLLGGFFACALGSMFFENYLHSFIGFMIVCLITAIPILLQDTKQYDIIVKSDEIEGPTRVKTQKMRISVSFNLIDLYRSKKKSFLRGGYITTKNGDKILIYNLYFNMNQTDLLFKELDNRVTK